MKEMEQETKVETQEEDQKDDKQEEQTSAANLPKTQEELDALIERKNLTLSLKGELSVNTGNGAGSRRSSPKTPHRRQPCRRKRPRVMLTRKN